jgi:hypothetical protein
VESTSATQAAAAMKIPVQTVDNAERD